MTFGILVAIAVIAAGVIKGIAFSSRRDDSWANAARTLGLRFEEPGWLSNPKLVGVMDGFSVNVTATSGKNANTRFKVTGASTPGLTTEQWPPITLGPESILSSVGKLLSGADVQTGDKAFDDLVLVRGNEVQVLSIFDAETRSLAIRATQLGARYASGELEIVRSGVVESSLEVETIVTTLVFLARCLTDRGRLRPYPTIADLVGNDPEPGVRLRCLELLLSRSAGADSHNAIASALDDPDPRVRVLAASRAAGPDATTILERIFEDRTLPVAIRQQALRGWDNRSPDDAATPILLRALDRVSGLPLIALEQLGKRKIKAAGPRLLSMLRGTQALEERVATVAALARIVPPGTEPALIALLAEGTEADVQRAAARALGEIGTVASVDPLLPHTKGVFGGGLKADALRAIELIQSRLKGAGAGHLSVAAAGDEGSLSLPDPAGALSMAKAGRKSPQSGS